MTTTHWQPFEADLDQILARYPRPLEALAQRQIPALVLRNAYPSEHATGLMQRFAERGYFSRDTVDQESQLSGGSYLDLGTSMGRTGADPDAFFAHAARTHQLFSHLFDGFADPVATMYTALQKLAPDKEVHTACEPDGRRYGPAIFRIYHGDEGHRAHYDSLARRSGGRSHYAAAQFDHQFAGILCMQSAEPDGEPFIYDCYADDEIDALVRAGQWDEYVQAQKIACAQVLLEPGDLYFFYTENIHAVPPVARATPRVVLAFFCAMAADREEIFVWS